MKFIIRRIICFLCFLISLSLWLFWKNQEIHSRIVLEKHQTLMQEKETEILQFKLNDSLDVPEREPLSAQQKLDVIAADLNILRLLFKDKSLENLSIDLTGYSEDGFIYFKFKILFNTQFPLLLQLLQYFAGQDLTPGWLINNYTFTGNGDKIDVHFDLIHLVWPPLEYGMQPAA